ncbi:C40 family peptidase [Micromonospora sicca]|uniref:NlpC/P60 family protein n=1 Tax=Micromonospora sicca TaxID=2202420 RepID=A0ABU5JL66_9ACTN|nr:NlpC/P60 family protein [Micromonospora sp. 4G53]MDZ5493365.1 NlpC/P60 family protein [Micromonospora sp. 4G53]
MATADCIGSQVRPVHRAVSTVAWAAAGVQLAHYTGDQWTAGVAVSRDNLRTGDLVFFYSDHHHVGIYVGNGLIVHAPHTGDVVRMAQMSYMPYSGARRPS